MKCGVKTLFFVVPCYNEQEVLNETAKRLLEKLEALKSAEKISDESRICFVDDGSKDRTWEIMSSLHKKNPVFSGLSLSRNRGHQNAIMAGLMPILWAHGTGSEVMSRIAAPMVGGMISSTVLTLAVIPAIYALIKGIPLPRDVVPRRSKPARERSGRRERDGLANV